MQMVECCVRRI